jgi:hypothetical protein
MNTSVDAGAVYYDWLDSDTTRQNGLWWFSMDDINDVEVYLGDTLIYGTDENGNTVNTYGISVDTYDDPENQKIWDLAIADLRLCSAKPSKHLLAIRFTSDIIAPSMRITCTFRV